jgi:putative Mg2+ transporter-C (MgtC) family protein
LNRARLATASDGQRDAGLSAELSQGVAQRRHGFRGVGVVLQIVPDMGTLDIALRLGAAALVGVLIGLNRDLHGKSTGVRTLGVLCLGSALAVLSIHAVTGSDESRVIQGIVTGVGFLGAGVIVRSEKGHHVQGLTTAACVWVTACLGAACAVAQWQIVVVGVVLVFIILALGGRFEKAIDRRWPGRPAQPAAQSPENAHLPSAEETDPSTHR